MFHRDPLPVGVGQPSQHGAKHGTTEGPNLALQTGLSAQADCRHSAPQEEALTDQISLKCQFAGVLTLHVLEIPTILFLNKVSKQDI